MTWSQAVVLLSLCLVCAADSHCDCFRTFDGASSVYTKHALLDFTKVNSVTASSYLTSPSFTSVFAFGDGNSSASALAPLAKSNRRENVYIYHEAGNSVPCLRMQSTRLQDLQSIAQFDSVAHDILYGSFRVKSRIHGASGAVIGIFTYSSNSQEADIEILTLDNPNQFHATNQPNDTPGATTVVRIPGSVANWNEWRLDWGSDQTQVLVNGDVVDKKTIHVPSQPSTFIVSLWSDGGMWSGTMAMGQSTFMDIEYIEMFYNSTSDGTKPCSTICNVGSGKPDGEASSSLPIPTSSGQSPTYSGIHSPSVDSSKSDPPATSTLPISLNPSATGSIDQCGANNGGAICAPGLCCSAHGYCGTSFYYCGAGCQAGFGTCS